jgi:hypothetical protein
MDNPYFADSWLVDSHSGCGAEGFFFLLIALPPIPLPSLPSAVRHVASQTSVKADRAGSLGVRLEET